MRPVTYVNHNRSRTVWTSLMPFRKHLSLYYIDKHSGVPFGKFTLLHSTYFLLKMTRCANSNKLSSNITWFISEQLEREEIESVTRCVLQSFFVRFTLRGNDWMRWRFTWGMITWNSFSTFVSGEWNPTSWRNSRTRTPQRQRIYRVLMVSTLQPLGYAFQQQQHFILDLKVSGPPRPVQGVKFLFFPIFSYFSQHTPIFPIFLAISSFFSYFLAILLTTSKYSLEVWTF